MKALNLFKLAFNLYPIFEISSALCNEDLSLNFDGG